MSRSTHRSIDSALAMFCNHSFNNGGTGCAGCGRSRSLDGELLLMRDCYFGLLRSQCVCLCLVGMSRYLVDMSQCLRSTCLGFRRIRLCTVGITRRTLSIRFGLGDKDRCMCSMCLGLDNHFRHSLQPGKVDDGPRENRSCNSEGWRRSNRDRGGRRRRMEGWRCRRDHCGRGMRRNLRDRRVTTIHDVDGDAVARHTGLNNANLTRTMSELEHQRL